MQKIIINGKSLDFVPSEPHKTIIKVQRLFTDSILPVRSTSGSAAFDLHVARYSMANPECTTLTYGSGLAFEFPENVYGLLLARSSCFKKKQMLANGIGLIDQDYRGEVRANFIIASSEQIYEKGERFCQLLIQGPNVNPFEVEFQEVKELGTTKRGHGGFGSTGL